MVQFGSEEMAIMMHVFITGVNEAKNAIQDSYCWDLNENSFS
jgi:hypothetical protein